MSLPNVLMKALACLVTGSINAFESIVAIARPESACRLRGEIVERLRSNWTRVHHNDVAFDLCTPNWLSLYRARHFSAKEPDTLAWIDSFETDDVFWDIGANVGVYSLYAAIRQPGAKVVAFEPIPANLDLLTRNIMRNGLSNRISIAPFPLGANAGVNRFRTDSLEAGAALSAFGVDYNHKGQRHNFEYQYDLFGVSLDMILLHFNSTPPNHLKIDVDGIEHLILIGGKQLLTEKNLRSILIETDSDHIEQKQSIHTLLTEAGFTLRSEYFKSAIPENSKHVHMNEVWVRRATD